MNVHTSEAQASLDFDSEVYTSADDVLATGECKVCGIRNMGMLTREAHLMGRHHTICMRAYERKLNELRVHSDRTELRPMARMSVLRDMYVSLLCFPTGTVDRLSREFGTTALRYASGMTTCQDLIDSLNKLNLDEEDAPASATCRVCLRSERTTVFEPCKHVVCCSTCADNVTECPICRAHIESRTRVYMS